MKLTKQNICVYIENEAQLQQAKELLEKHGEEIAEDGTFSINKGNNQDFLQLFIDDKWWVGMRNKYQKQITLSELETILKNDTV